MLNFFSHIGFFIYVKQLIKNLILLLFACMGCNDLLLLVCNNKLGITKDILTVHSPASIVQCLGEDFWELLEYLRLEVKGLQQMLLTGRNVCFVWGPWEVFLAYLIIVTTLTTKIKTPSTPNKTPSTPNKTQSTPNKTQSMPKYLFTLICRETIFVANLRTFWRTFYRPKK